MSNEDSANLNAIFRMSRRRFVQMAGLATGAIAFGGMAMRSSGLLPPLTTCAAIEVQPYITSPFIVTPFMDIPENQLPQLKAMAPGWRPDPTLPGPQVAWTVRRSKFLANPVNPTGAGIVVPGPAEHQQDVYGHLFPGETVVSGVPGDPVQTVAVEHAGTHQVWPVPLANPPAIGGNFDRLINWPAAGVEPILYHIRMQLGTHKFTTSKVRPTVALPAGAPVTLDANGETLLPDSVIYGFNGTFPGALINVEYGKPALVRFENDLDKNPQNLDRQNFGAPDFAFLTHRHNGHSAPESDGQPHYMQINEGGYTPGDWVDNLYLMYPAGGDPAEIQSFLWFHDHRMHHTGANVYKGMVGLMPIYDPGIPANPGAPADANGNVPGTGLDPGDETKGLHLPGVRVNNPDGTFDVKYDIHMALYDVALEDGVTQHADMHTDPAVCRATHPEWWGRQFFKHFPNNGFVGDIFTVNCTAFPVLHVLKRRYRFRFLDASVVRIYELALMTSAAGPVAAQGTQGQWQIPDGLQWKPWTLIASMGGLLPQATLSETFHIWPASRLEFEVDFTNEPAGKEIFLTNVLVMTNGRRPNPFNSVATPADLNGLPSKVPVMKIIVDGDPLPEPDNSIPVIDANGTPRPLRPMPKLADGTAITLATTAALPQKTFTLSANGPTPEEFWVINNLPFDPLVPLTTVVRDQPEVWTTTNGGNAWVHPMHMHQEEHTTLARGATAGIAHPEDAGKSDVANLEPAESVTFYRNFRTFTGRYVAHCHNLAHEDHNMMFGWSILAPPPVGAFAISGTLTDRGAAPLSGVTMHLAGAASLTTTTDANGNYSFTGLPDGSYTVTPIKPGFRFIVPSRKVSINGANVTRRNFTGVGR